jgi:xanthine dehydrogenase large subunit
VTRPRPATPRRKGAVHAPLPHDSAEQHVRGAALYVDDLPEPRDLLHASVRLSERAHARIVRLDVGAAARSPGVAAVMTARDLPGGNDIGPVHPGDPIFADGVVEYFGQSVLAVAAETMEQARQAAQRAEIEYEDLPAILTVEEALARKSFVLPTEELLRGKPEEALARSPRRLSGRLQIGGQDHFYLEGQIAMAVPREDGGLLVHSSTQHPTEVQHLVAKILGRPDSAVTVEVRRLGGAFGSSSGSTGTTTCCSPASGTTSSSTTRWGTTTWGASSGSGWCSPRAAGSRPTCPAR